MERNAETKVVKAALKREGIAARVTHGNGTSWGWLYVSIVNPCTVDHYATRTTRGDCPTCQAAARDRDRALRIVQAATGRRGEYDGQIVVREA